ncbi:uncharacterized protein LOC113491778 [Trichoplusia ni]|uniref:Uncharacterized protein LOC113491777 n=1 Tax=Trichoplusia ni TaxID=7111 RepID=A0A7E5V8Y4_TRINI|nr:uncharacterized protein LOC113491777 [Trichoplusia ni]XP_026724744.1 uncharacterized protein LOC113491778 [Trichoplusia ni]
MWLSFGISTYYYVATMFGVIYHVLYENEKKYINIPVILYFWAYYVSFIFVMLVASNDLSNEGLKLTRRLSELYCKTSINLTSDTKLLKDLYILVKNNPIQIKCRPNTAVGTNIIPILMSICVSYAIVVLQFSQL